MRVFLSSKYLRNFRKLKKTQPALVTIVKKQIRLFQENPAHPSLKLHKLGGRKHTAWSFWIKGDLRVIFVYIHEGVLLVDIGDHKEVY